MAAILQLDTKHEVKLERFSGAEEELPLWCSRFESYGALMGWTPVLQAAASHPTPLPLSVLGEDAKAVSMSLHYLLLHKTAGTAVGIVRLVGAGKNSQGLGARAGRAGTRRRRDPRPPG